ncbi:hypothetical protein [Streptomyces sp. NPDC060194]|uniref:hypothetical protein n=1 Tax=Streptomyces sp. NPDC060194 TaxID=3347069 RepID=UPI00364A5594
MDGTRGIGVRTAAALMCAAALSACGAGGGTADGDGAGTRSPSPPASASATPSDTPSDAPSEAPAEDPAKDLDRLAVEQNWGIDGPASAWIARMCAEFDDQDRAGQPPGKWLVEDFGPTPDEEAALTAGMPELCTRWWPEIGKALGAVEKRAYPDGVYEVSGAPGEDPELIEPGTYRAADPTASCSWQRTSPDGDVLDGQRATTKAPLTVTVQATDGTFTTKGCGVWKPVR